MTRKGPLLTLAGGAVVAAALLVASISAATGDDDRAPALAGEASPAAGPTAETAAAPAEAADPLTYVGWVDEGGASVAIVVTGDEATAYLCDGVQVEAWLTGSARNGELLLTGDDGSLVGSYDPQQAAGQADTGGQAWTFQVDAVAYPDGLYRFADTVVGGAEVDGGWIVLPDGTQVGLLTVDGQTSPAPAIDPATGQVEVAGSTITADRIG